MAFSIVYINGSVFGLILSAEQRSSPLEIQSGQGWCKKRPVGDATELASKSVRTASRISIVVGK